MVAVTDRDTFEAAVFKPPHLARMLEICGQFTGRLDSVDREYVQAAALDRFFEIRERIKCAPDVEKVWVQALEHTVASRPVWHVAVSHWGVAIGKQWVKWKHLRSKP